MTECRPKAADSVRQRAGKLACLAPALWLAGLGCSPPPVEIPRLDSGPLAVEEMIGGQSHTYALRLEQNQYLHLVVDQRQIDVIVELLDPRGREVIVVDSPNGKRGPEHVMSVTREAGDHHLVVRSGNGSRAGSYEIRFEELRRATEADHHRSAAARDLNRGQQLKWEGGDSLAEAVEVYGRALDAWRAAKDVAWEVETLGRMGLALEQMDLEAEALDRYREASEASRRENLRDEEAVILNRMGRVFRELGEFQQAFAVYEQSLKIHQDLGNEKQQATVLNNMALLYKSVGEAQKALDLYDHALTLWRRLGDPTREATTLSNIGELYNSLGQFEFALDALRRALQLRAADDANGRAVTLNSLGVVHRRLGQLDLALGEFQQALELRRGVGNRRGMAVDLNAIGNTYYEMGNLQQALSSYERALANFRETGDLRGTAYARVNIGWIYLDRKAPEDALTAFDQALPIFGRLGDAAGEASALFGIARAEALRGQLVAARVNVGHALERIESLRRGSHSQAMRSSFLATKHHYYEFSIDVLMRLHETEAGAGYEALALAESERSRALSLLETLIESHADIRQGVDRTLLERERTIQARLNLLEQDRLALEGGEPDGDRMQALTEELRSRLREYQQLQAQIRTSSPKYAALTQPEHPEARAIQREVLDQGTLLLEYSLGEERSYLWVVSHRSIESFVLPGREEIEQQARRVHRLLRLSARPDVTIQARLATEKLSRLLLGPIADRLAAKQRLLVVATGALQYLPFAALRPPAVDGTSETEPLVIDHEVVHLPSASLLRLLRQELEHRTPAPRTLAVVADPVSPSFEVLHSAGEELREIMELVPQEQRLAVAGFEATREFVASGGLKDFQIVHFATHSVIDTRHPELSGIVLSLVDPSGRSRDGFLRAHEIYNLDLPAELVVLAACETALGREIRGEGLLGLTQGFLYAGAARVIVSLWSVGDASTRELMTRFYVKLLKDELSPAAALRAAQVSMLREPRWEAPYHWAAFHLQGEWRK